jgi:N-acetylated-alpha-linked acidic dipeptidase
MRARLFLVAVLAGCIAASPAQRTDERAAEARFAAAISTEHISEFHRRLTREPHIAGTPAGRAVAEEIAAKLRSFGLETEIRTYQVYLSHPVRLRLALLKPEPRELPVTEPANERDASTGHPALTPGFIAYSASGRVRAPVVYVNYGLPADYAALEAAGVSVRGAIVLARYGRVHRAVKVHTAEQRGARGILIYSDPADDGFAQGPEWPDGPWRAPWMIQRGNAKYSWHWHGDPLTPGVAATPDAPRLPAEEAPTLPKIPAAAISWSAAEPILRALGGAAAPRGFQGALPFTYRLGPGPAEIELEVEMDAGLKPISNVIARLPGAAEPDRWVLLGTHHDAWTFGGADPGSAAAVILEVARALGELRRNSAADSPQNWQPRRSIVFAFWDAEEYGLIGSTEFAEEFAVELREKVVAYINSDLYLAGYFRAGGAASLRDFVSGVARDTPHPGGRGSIYDAWREQGWQRLAPAEKRRRGASFEVELDPLGSGADFVPFQTHLGLPSLSLEFGLESGYAYGSYHSSYDTRQWMETFGDPGWRFGRALAELLGRAAMRLADAEALPMRFTHTAGKLRQYVARLEEENADASGKPYLAELGLDSVRSRLAEFEKQARQVDTLLETNAARPSLAAEELRRLNDHLSRAEKSFLAPEDREADGSVRWYRHTVYGWNIYALYAGQTLPALHRAMTARDAAAFARERARLEAALAHATSELAAAMSVLTGGK